MRWRSARRWQWGRCIAGLRRRVDGPGPLHNGSERSRRSAKLGRTRLNRLCLGKSGVGARLSLRYLLLVLSLALLRLVFLGGLELRNRRLEFVDLLREARNIPRHRLQQLHLLGRL